MGWGGGKGGFGGKGGWGGGKGLVGAAIVGGLAGAAVASSVGHHPRHYAPHRPEVVVVGGGAAPVVVVEARPRKGKGGWKGKGKGRGYAPAIVVVEQSFPAIATLSVPAGQDETRGDTHYFAVDVLPEGGGGAWRVMRRYNEFHDLYDKFGKHTFPAAPFPGKHLMGIGLNMEKRRRGLEAWIQCVAAHPNSKGAWAGPFNDFLTAGRQPLSTLAVAVAMAVPAEASPVMSTAPSAPPLEEEDDGSSVLAIEIPAGVAAGAVLGITVMDGTQVNFTVPEHKHSGDTVELWYDAAAGTLTPM